jgi:glycosyltransferase involved in cell wall biosynthesis
VREHLAARFANWITTFEHRDPRVLEAEAIEHACADLIVCSSTFARATLLKGGIPHEKIRIIPLGVNLSVFTPPVVRSDQPFRFVFVGSVSAQKGVPLILDAWRSLQPTGAELWLAGSVSNRARGLIPDLPGLKILGQVPSDRVQDLLRQCNVLLFPSYFEGFGLVLLEAMACGLPVIAASSTGAPDLILTAGDGGWIIPPGDLQSLAEAMQTCLAHPARTLNAAVRARQIAEAHSWFHFGEGWSKLLAEEIGQRRVQKS